MYRIAVRERNPRKMLVRIEQADTAILRELAELPADDCGIERRALADALKNLTTLRESVDLAERPGGLPHDEGSLPGHRGWKLIGSSRKRNDLRRI
jgi:hypothetical protein